MLFSTMIKNEKTKHTILEGTTLKTEFECGCVSRIIYQEKQKNTISRLSPSNKNLKSSNSACTKKHDEIDFSEFLKMKVSSPMAIVTEILGFNSIKISLGGRIDAK